jgi:hypothetical protein
MGIGTLLAHIDAQKAEAALENLFHQAVPEMNDREHTPRSKPEHTVKRREWKPTPEPVMPHAR